MASGVLTLKIITPDRIVLDEQVDEVMAKAIDGEFAVLPGHEPLITALAIDVVRYKTKGVEHSAAVMGGLLEVGEVPGTGSNEVASATSHDRLVTVLSDLAELDTEVDAAKAHEEKERAEAQKITKTDKIDLYLSEMAMSKAMARLKAAELGRRRRGNRISE
jgi:F-type H+-transporting ATPase subunit epsilon